MPALDNPKHERFAQELAKGKSADDAYQEAGYKPNRGNASTLKANQIILDRVAELQERGAIRAEITIQSLLDEAEQARVLAMKIDNPAAAMTAIQGKAKLAGLWVDRSENENINTSYVVSGEPVEDIEQWEREHSPQH